MVNKNEQNLILISHTLFSEKKSRSDGRRKSKGGSSLPYPLLWDFSLVNMNNVGISAREYLEQYKIFPGAKEYLFGNLRKAKKILKELQLKDQLYKYNIKKSVPESRQWFWNDLIDGVYAGPDMMRAETLIKKLTFVLEEKPQSSKDPLNIEKAKMYPISKLIEFRNGIAKCIFHTEKTGSMKYYPATNSIFCFGCSQYADSIKVYQTLFHCDFKTAVKALQ